MIIKTLKASDVTTKAYGLKLNFKLMKQKSNIETVGGVILFAATLILILTFIVTNTMNV